MGIAKVSGFCLVDAKGAYAFGTDQAAARTAYTETIGALEETDGFRLIKVTLTVPVPPILEMSGDVPELPAPGKLTVS
jgi:hypothetical protein